MKKTIILFFFLFLLVLPSVFSIPPISTVQQITRGYNIVDSSITILKQNENYQYNFFVYNLSDGMLITNSTAKCTFYISNSTGEVIYYNDSIYDLSGYWRNDIAGGNFSHVGFYAHGTKCNSSYFGGAIEGVWEVTENGKTGTFIDTSGSISITIFILLITLGVFYLAFMKRRLVRSPITDLILRRSAIVLGIYLMVFNSAIIATIAEQSNIDLTNEIFTFMWIFGQAGYIAMLVLVIKSLFEIAGLLKQRKEQKRSGDYEEN